MTRTQQSRLMRNAWLLQHNVLLTTGKHDCKSCEHGCKTYCNSNSATWKCRKMCIDIEYTLALCDTHPSYTCDCFTVRSK
jgi:hypothetical protein